VEKHPGGTVAQWKWYVYILECLDDSNYTGLTWKINPRYEQHLSGLGGVYTRKHGVKRLTYLEEHTDFGQARKREHQIKDWSRAKKEKLISGEWEHRG